MKKGLSYIIPMLLMAAVCLSSFTGSNTYFNITSQDVVLKIPKGFPPPLYNFNKNKLTPEAFTLGRRLFYDPILSKDSSISCASCHQRIAAFAHFDHPLSHGINGLFGKRNVAPLQDLIWKDAYMWDGGVNNLELQPLNPITNAVEMNETLANVIKKLQASPVYVALFDEAFHSKLITSERLFKALAQFTGLMISANSRYDKYMRGEDTLSSAEMRGIKLFRADCAACHKEPLFTDNSYRNNGLAMDTSLNDEGRKAITGVDADYMKFKVPSLRNIEMTYPYMHDGRFRTLQQVVDHYTTGISQSQTTDPLLKNGFALTAGDKKDIISFLKTLTDQDFLHDRRFADPNFIIAQ